MVYMIRSLKTVVLGGLAFAIAVFSWGVLSQSPAGETLSMAEVQAFIEEKVGEGFPVDEVISSGLELGYRPELLAAALINLSIEPAVIAVALAAEGVSRVDAAKAVISVAGPPSSTQVTQALLIGASPDEVKVLTEQVDQLVAQLNRAPIQETAATEREVVATEEPEPEPGDKTAQESVLVDTEPATTKPASIAEAELTTEQATSDETVTATNLVPTIMEPMNQAPPVVLVIVEPTPPIMGGGGGSTRN